MKQTKFNLTAATLCLLPVFFIQSVSGGSKVGAPSEVVQVWSAGSENGEENVTPTNFDPTEVEALKAIATANPGCTDLQEFIDSEGWKENQEDPTPPIYNIGVKWNEQNPAHIEKLFITHQYNALEKLDLSAFKFLKSIDVSYNSWLSELDLTQQTALKNLVITGTALSFSKVKLANNIQLDYCGGSSSMQATEIGTPIDANTSLVASGTEIDLSSEASINGQVTIYNWSKEIVNENNHLTTTPVSMDVVSAGKFKLEGNPGEIYFCDMTNPTFPQWALSTRFKISRSCTYNEQDINGLKKLAEDNSHFTKLLEFVNAEGWKLENWESRQDIIKTDWKVDENNVARLTHLYIEPDYGREDQDYIDKLDISAFEELQHLECERFNRITSLDLSKNTKLEVLRIYTGMESLDVSSCPDLKELTFRDESSWLFGYSGNLLVSLNITGCTKLTKLQLVGSPLANLDISNLPLLETLFIENCKELQIKGDISRLKYLQELGLNYTTQFEQHTKNLPESVICLRYMGANYPLPGDEVLGRLEELNLPLNTKSFDLTKTPKMKKLILWKSEMRFSTLTRADNMSDPYQYTGESYYILPGSSIDNRPVFKKGDKIDLSSEAVIDGKKTTYIWVNRKYNIEDTETFTEDPEHPGIFTVNQNVEGGDYTCKMGNPLFTGTFTVNTFGGWIVLFECQIEGEASQDNFSESDVTTLNKIVNASSSDLLKSWWNEGAWQKDDLYKEKIAIVWNNENPRRLSGLTFMNFDMGLDKLDVSGLDALKELVCIENHLTGVTLPKNTTELNTLVLDGNPITTLIVSPYANLQTLGIQSTNIKSCDLSNNREMHNLYCNGTDVSLNDLSIYPDLKELGVPTGQKTLNLQDVPKLTKLFLAGSKLKFSDIQNPRQLENVSSSDPIVTGNVRGKATSYGSKMNCSAEMKVGGTASQISWSLASNTGNPLQGGTDGIYNITDQLNPGDKLIATITNSLFPGWTLIMETTLYTCSGDANLDKAVNVQDITASVSEILQDTENRVTPFGELEADVNEDGKLDVSDVVGIVGIIQDKPVVKSMLRSDYTPVVRLSKDGKGFLYMDAPVAIAGIQLTFTGVNGTLPLLGEAARFVQTAVAGDTLRMLAYSADGTTLPSGKSVLMQLPAGARLIGAVFSDANACSLKSEGGDIATSSEVIQPKAGGVSICNYPNPFQNATTFSYTLKEEAQDAVIQIFSANGALVKTFSGLPAVAGQNSYPCTLSLPAGVYYYRLSVRNAGNMKVSKSNLFIIK